MYAHPYVTQLAVSSFKQQNKTDINNAVDNTRAYDVMGHCFY